MSKHRLSTRRLWPLPPWLPLSDLTLLTEMEHIAVWLEDTLARARHEILLENYIFQAGAWPERIFRILVQQARAGVRVYLTLDALGSREFPARWARELEAAGAHLHWYHRLSLRGLEGRLRRTHRRLVLVDGRCLAVGGFAISDAWLSGHPGNRPYRDVLLAGMGAIAGRGRSLFALGLDSDLPAAAVSPPAAASPWGEARLLAGNPPRRMNVRRRYMAAFKRAQQSLWIATPYFNPDPRVLSLLYAAVRRGVDVRVLLAGRITDHPLLRFGIQAYYQKLLRHGIRVYEYEGCFLHGKYVQVDGLWASVGSANLDFLSLWFNRELNMELRGAVPNLLLRTLFLREFARAHEIVLDGWARRPWWRRPLEGILAWIDGWVQARAMGARRY
ncbi:phosphatidylserine/phosphatidylglycerophosphate/cardiolipin synthase family protein [Acidithiobacillus sp.]|uniref:phospholipase D-like domain-containing protein n=1 Tax=Acidithiobacillus sp. TaxID=1872118 RepID=UPI0025BA84A5|nr:cardiolipin synthase B [Acidithiobacillus sp.]